MQPFTSVRIVILVAISGNRLISCCDVAVRVAPETPLRGTIWCKHFAPTSTMGKGYSGDSGPYRKARPESKEYKHATKSVHNHYTCADLCTHPAFSSTFMHERTQAYIHTYLDLAQLVLELRTNLQISSSNHSTAAIWETCQPFCPLNTRSR